MVYNEDKGVGAEGLEHPLNLGLGQWVEGSKGLVEEEDARALLPKKHRPSIRQYTSAYVSMRQHTSAYVRIRQHTSAYVSS